MSIERRRPGGVPSELHEEWTRLAKMSDDQLDAELSTTLELTATTMVRLALIVRQKEERGHDLSELKIGMLNYLRRIAYGQLLPEVLARYGSYPSVLRRVSAMPIPDQRKCLETGGVRLAVWDGEKMSHRIADLTQMSQAELRQAFAPDHLRNPEEQASWARTQPSFPAKSVVGPIEVDKKHASIIVTGDRIKITREQLLMYLASLG